MLRNLQTPNYRSNFQEGWLFSSLKVLNFRLILSIVAMGELLGRAYLCQEHIAPYIRKASIQHT